MPKGSSTGTPLHWLVQKVVAFWPRRNTPFPRGTLSQVR